MAFRSTAIRRIAFGACCGPGTWILALGLWELAPDGLNCPSLRETEWEIVGRVALFERSMKIYTLTLMWSVEETW